MTLFRERQQAVICVAACAMIGGFVLFRHLPLRRRIKAVEQTKAAQTVVVHKALAEAEQLPALEEQLHKLEGMVGSYEAKVPGRRGLGVFLQQIANLTSEHNLRGQLVQPGEEIEADGLSCIPIDMQCKGKLKQIFGFLGSLQALERMVRIERVKLVNDSDFGGEVSMQTRTVIYYTREGEQG
jgi:Tfp pilus assembly protein PilO